MVGKSYRPWNPDQLYLLPPSPKEWLPQDHLAYFILDVVGTLDLSDIERKIQVKDRRGERPYAPQMMVALLLYGYCVGIFSSRKLAKATFDDVAFRVLTGESHPYFTTINQFRLDHRDALAGRFLQVLQMCQKAGLVQLGHVSLDGSKFQANASKHKAMSYERMKKEEERLKAEIAEMLERADAVDREEDGLHGEGQDAHDLPEEFRRREGRLEKIREAMTALENEAAQTRAEQLRQQAEGQREKAADESVDVVERKRCATRAEKAEKRADELDPPKDDEPPSDAGPPAPELPRHRVPTTPQGAPAPKAQRNFTDPESRIMKNNKGYWQGYNAQIAVDAQSQVIVAEALTNQAPDQEHFQPVLRRVIDNCGKAPDNVSADSGYFSLENIQACEPWGLDPYIAVGREKKDKVATAQDSSDESTTAAQLAKQRMRQKLQTEAGRAVYSRRKTIVEPPFGQIKEARGFRRFSLRGLAKVRSEWTLICLTHNLLKLFRSGWPAKSAIYPSPATMPA